MLDAAWRQLRHGWAVATGRRIRVADVQAIVTQLRATLAEFGRLDQDRMLEALDTATDPEFRASMIARGWQAAVRAAYEESVYYRDALDRIGLRPKDLTFDRRAELPPTPKAMLRALPEAFVSSRANPSLQACTTGTTGTPTSCWFSAYELDLAAAYGAASLIINIGIREQDVIQVCSTARAAGSLNLLGSARLAGAACVVSGVIDPDQALSRMATPVHLAGKKPKVSVLSISPSYLGLLLHTARRLGYVGADFGVERILCGGEVLSDALWRQAEDFFGATVYDNYGMTETFPVAGLVCSQRHLHFPANLGLVEVLDPVTFAPSRPGEVGMLVVTPFPPYRETTLVLRLATGDLVRQLAEEPTCELKSQAATSQLLGKEMQGVVPLYQRQVLDLLEATTGLPMPPRYCTEPADDGFELHVFGPEEPGLMSQLEDRAADAGLPVRKIVLHASLSDLPRPSFNRALLREAVVVHDEEAKTWTLR